MSPPARGSFVPLGDFGQFDHLKSQARELGSVMHHPSGIPEKIVRKVVARRGRLHAFETLTPSRTALVVVDLDAATVRANEECQGLTPRVNELAAAVRRSGGVVAWVTSSMPVMPKHFATILGTELAAKYFTDGQPNGAGTVLWHELEISPQDLHATKSGASTFFPGKCNLKEQLDHLGIDTLLIAGAVTNICCESSARDAVELDYKVIMVSNVLSGHAHGLHEATLATFYRVFGDVRPSDEIIQLLGTTSPNNGLQPTAARASI
jgi:nicotinamidase-related amidase